MISDQIEFLLWATRGVHLFAVVVWIGGMLYQSAITIPLTRNADGTMQPHQRDFLRRFLPFVWMSVWTILITGVGLMLFDPRFIFFRYDNTFSILLGVKQLLFLVLILFSYGFSRMFHRMDEILLKQEKNGKERAIVFQSRMLQFGRLNVVLAILTLLVAAAI